METVKFNENSGLMEAIRSFSDPMVCLETVSKAKWPRGRVMSEPKDKAEAEEKPKPRKPPGYRKFEKLLKQVVKAPPLYRNQKGKSGTAS